MRVIKYFFVGALTLCFSAQVMAQDVKSQIDAITKVIIANKNNPDAVKDQVKDYVKANKKNAEALAGLGRAYLDIKDTLNTRKYAEMAIKAGKKEAAGYLLQGDLAAFNNDGGEAAMWYETAINQDPKDPTGYIKYARVYQKVDADGAEEKLRQLVNIDPSYPVDAEIAHMYYVNNKFAKALENYQKVDKSKLDDSKLLEFSMAALLLGKPDVSVEISEYGAQKKPRSAGFNRITFYDYTDLKEYDKALKFADALFNNSDSAKFTSRDYLYLGHAYKGSGNTDKAIESFNKSYELDNTQADVLKLISDTYLDAKNYDKAVEYLNQYLAKEDSKKVSDYTALAKIYMTMADDPTRKDDALKKADQVYVDLATAFPNNEDYATYQRATIHHMMNPDVKQGAAKPYYEKYAQMLESRTDRSKAEDASLAVAYNYLCVYFIQNDNVATAKEYANKLLALQPDNETAKQIIAIK